MRFHTAAAFAIVFAWLVTGAPAQTGAPPARDPAVDQLVSRVIEAYGGEKALRAVRGYHAGGNQWAAQSDQPVRGERWFARPDRLRLDLDYPDHHEIRITEGEVGWAGSSVQDLQPAIPMKLQAMRLQTARLDLPLRLLEQRDHIEARGTDAEGRAVLRLPIDAALYIDYHIDPKTGYATRITTGMTQPRPMEFTSDYEQFQDVDGVRVPFHEVSYAGNTIISKFQMIEFEWNPKDLESRLRPRADAGD